MVVVVDVVVVVVVVEFLVSSVVIGTKNFDHIISTLASRLV